TGVEAPGIGYAPPAIIAAQEAGRIRGVDVALHQQVFEGDIVARVDSSLVEAELRVAEAELLASREQTATEVANEARRFAEGREGAALERARAEARLAEARAQESAAIQQLDLARGLAERGAGAAQEVIRLEQQLTIARSQVSAWGRAVAEASRAGVDAGVREQALPAGEGWAVVAAARRVDLLEKRVAESDLTSPLEGQVTWIHRRPGDTVQAGEPVLEVQQASTDQVVAWLAPSQLPALTVGGSAGVVRSDGAWVAGRLVSIGAGPRALPDMLWHNAAQPEWGVPVRVQLEGGQVVPGEALTVRL
ncbi:MAG: multidrug resistance efflux pump, partial [Myxococcota bacterium]